MKPADFYILFDRIHVHAANAISSPLTYGFPAPSGFLGAMHALERRLPEDCRITFSGVLIASHRCDVQTFRADAYSDATFIQSRHPLKKDGKTASIIEEGKVHLVVSLVVAAHGEIHDIMARKEALESILREQLFRQRIAGGSITNMGKVSIYQPHQATSIKTALLPAYVLMDASDELPIIQQEMQLGQKVVRNRRKRPEVKEEKTGYPPQPDTSALDVLLATAKFFHIPPQDDAQTQDDTKTWHTYHIRSGRGWLVPIPVGYQGISPEYAPGIMQNSRNPEYPAQYVENLYSLGKWVFPHRLPEDLANCFWHYSHPQPNLFLITQTP